MPVPVPLAPGLLPHVAALVCHAPFSKLVRKALARLACIDAMRQHRQQQQQTSTAAPGSLPGVAAPPAAAPMGAVSDSAGGADGRGADGGCSAAVAVASCDQPSTPEMLAGAAALCSQGQQADGSGQTTCSVATAAAASAGEPAATATATPAQRPAVPANATASSTIPRHGPDAEPQPPLELPEPYFSADADNLPEALLQDKALERLVRQATQPLWQAKGADAAWLQQRVRAGVGGRALPQPLCCPMPYECYVLQCSRGFGKPEAPAQNACPACVTCTGTVRHARKRRCLPPCPPPAHCTPACLLPAAVVFGGTVVAGGQVGNTYTACVWFGLASWVWRAGQAGGPCASLRQRLLLFSFGSGTMASLLSLTVGAGGDACPAAAATAGGGSSSAAAAGGPDPRFTLQRMQAVLDLGPRLGRRMPRSVAQYDAASELLAAGHSAVPPYEPRGDIADVPVGAYYLQGVDQMHRRVYVRRVS